MFICTAFIKGRWFLRWPALPDCPPAPVPCWSVTSEPTRKAAGKPVRRNCQEQNSGSDRWSRKHPPAERRPSCGADEQHSCSWSGHCFVREGSKSKLNLKVQVPQSETFWVSFSPCLHRGENPAPFDSSEVCSTHVLSRLYCWICRVFTVSRNHLGSVPNSLIQDSISRQMFPQQILPVPPFVFCCLVWFS